MEPLAHQPEESVCQSKRHYENDEGSQQLNAKEFSLADYKETSILVKEAKGYDTPQSTEQVRLSRLKWVIKLESIKH